MLYVYVHPVKGLPNVLCRSCRLCCSHRQRRRRRPRRSSEDPFLYENDIDHDYDDKHDHEDDPVTVGDNHWHWHNYSLLLVAGLPDADLVYAQFHNRFSLVPYCILLDHTSQSVIVSVRETLSLEDLVTDVMMDPVAVEALGVEFGFDATDQYCHAGPSRFATAWIA